ncbi:MAG: hypothetical protein LBC68_15255 [Prevotellaceae bacterium]|jgi:hypothetical protein|nr:hypothetical protein [Prevotellaceae bacterium]
MPKKPAQIIATLPETVDKKYLFFQTTAIIEKGKNMAAVRASSATAVMFWKIGHFINTTLLGDNRAEYGKQIFPTLPGKLSGGDYV